MNDSFSMDYRWKDIYVTLLPGFYLIILLAVILSCRGLFEFAVWNQVFHYVEKASGLAVILFPLLFILTGALVNGIASTFMSLSYRTGIVLRPHAQDYFCYDKCFFNRRIAANDAAHKEHRKAINSLAPNAKIEEYFVHFAMGRNMFFSQLIALILGLFVWAGWCIFFYNVAMAIILYQVFRHHHERYEDIILSEKTNQRTRK